MSKLMFGAFVMTVTSAACGGRESAPAVMVRDSAGIAIVESQAVQWNVAAAWKILPTPRVEIGLVDGAPEYLFSNIEGAVLLDDGRIAVADRGSSQLRFYQPDGTYDRFSGGPGEGPGELGYIRGMGRCGADSVYVFELDYETVVFDPSGRYVRQARPYDQNTADRRPYALECASNGYYAAVGWEDRSGPPVIGFYRSEAQAWILAPEDALPADAGPSIPQAGLVIAASLGTVLSSERVGHERGSGPHPFGRATRIAMTPSAVYMGTGEAFEVKRYELNGRLEGVVRWAGGDLTIREEDIEAYRAAELERVAEANRPALERQLREQPMPPAFPAYQRLETDPDGNLWVQHYARPGQPRHEWSVFNSDGGWLGVVGLPTDFELTDIGTSLIVGIARDELGVERIRAYDLVKPNIE